MKLTENPNYAGNYVNLRETDNELIVTGELDPISDDFVNEPEFYPIERGCGCDFIVWQPGDGRLTIIDSNRNAEHVGFLAEQPDDIFHVDDRSFEVVTTTKSILYENIDGEWIATELPDSFPVAEIATTDPVAVSADVDKRKLTGTPDSARFEPSNTDLGNATADILNAYSTMRRAANNEGRFIQPIFARYRLLDSSGNLLHLSPPSLIKGASENNLSKQLTFNSESPAIEKYTLETGSYSLNVKLGDTTDARVAAMIVETTPEIDRTDFDGTASLHLLRDSSTGVYHLTVKAPTLSENAYKAMLSGTIDNLESLFTPVARIENPFSGNIRTVAIKRPATPPKSEYKSINRRLRSLTGSLSTANYTIISTISPPHSFTSRFSAANGSAIIYADLTAKRFKGYGIENFTLNTSDEPWRASVAVTFANGTETVVKSSEGNTNAPVSLLPMLSYPSVDAVSMTISLQRAGCNFKRSFPLNHSIGENLSYYISSGINPITFDGFETDSYIIPAATSIPRKLTGIIASALISNPRNPVSAATTDFANINACVAADGNSSGWENSKSRFLLFTSSGIHKATVDSKGHLGSLSRISHATVECNQAVAVTPGSGIIALTSDGDLMKIKGTSVSLLDHTGGTMLAYDNSRRELWIAGQEHGNSCIVRDMQSGRYHTRSLPSQFQTAANSREGSVAVIGNKLYNLSGNEKTGTTEMSLTVEQPLSAAAPPGVRRAVATPRMRSVEIDMSATSVESLTVGIRANHGNGFHKSTPIAKFILSDGSVNSPLLFNVASTPVKSVFVNLSGKIAAGSAIRNIYFNKRQ